MMIHNHLLLAAAGAWSASILAPSMTVGHGPYYWAIVLAGAMLPDLDTRHSYLGRRLPMISIPLGMVVGHRTLTHSLWPIVILAVAAYAMDTVWLYWLSFGIALHIFGDFVTNSGVPLLWPLPRKFSSGITVRTGGVFEFAMAALIVGCVYLATSLLAPGGTTWWV